VVRVEVVHVGGRYAQRVIAHLSAMSPGAVSAFQVPRALPPVLDDPAEFLPAELGRAETIIAINIHPELLLELPERAKGGTLRALIAPIEDPSWVKPGLQRQVTLACSRHGIESAFPKPFCALEPNTPAIAEFCEQFKVGVPTFRIRIADGRVAAAEVVWGSPCGLTAFVAEQLVGLPADELLPKKAGGLHHSYPCLASMALDPDTGDTIMHASLALIITRVQEALQKANASGDGQA
jgi:hypothetical protein